MAKPQRVLATDPRRIDSEDDWTEQPAQVIERSGNLARVQFEDGSEHWLAPHEVRPA